MEQIPEPSYGPNDVMIRMKKTAICGTDMHIWHWDEWAQRTIKVPMAVGHEYAGEIVALGSEVRGLAIGDRVSGEGHITCGHCRNCRAGRRHLCRNTVGVGVNRPGCFAEYMSLPASNVFKLPAVITDEIALDPGSTGNATHTAHLSTWLANVLISGAGPSRYGRGDRRHVGRATS
jgi:threonine 3-dehydrogenase